MMTGLVRWTVVLLLAGLGVVMVAAPVAAPDAVDHATGTVRLLWHRGTALVSGEEMPRIELASRPGGARELDACTGAWVRQAAYSAQAGVPAVYASHNYCGGDVVLDWAVGQRVRVEGRGVYAVSGVKQLPADSTAAGLVGVKGAMLLQTCEWGSADLRIVALDPVG